MRSKLTIRRIWLVLLALGALAALLPTTLLGRPGSAPIVQPTASPTSIDCTDGTLAAGTRTFDLVASEGRIQTPDGNSVYMWGYGLETDTKGHPNFQMPGPTLCANEGETIVVNLRNTLPDPVSIVFPGQTGVSATGDATGLFTEEANPSGGTASYTFAASEPGTYIYESGTEQHKQIELGLYGALIIDPALNSNPDGKTYAYNDTSTEYDPEREFLILMHDMDPNLHHAIDTGGVYNITEKHDRYWTVSGRSFPDSIAAHGVSWLPDQPYGSMVWVELFEEGSGDLPALIRMANVGLSNHPFHPHGNNLRVIGRDGRALIGPSGEDISKENFTNTIGSGQTIDLTFRFENDNFATITQDALETATGTTIPELQNQVFKDGASFYSGSSQIGATGELPPSVTVFNQCGEFYFPWHSHALNEFQNFDEGFGGLATLVRVDPPGGCDAVGAADNPTPPQPAPAPPTVPPLDGVGLNDLLQQLPPELQEQAESVLQIASAKVKRLPKRLVFTTRTLNCKRCKVRLRIEVDGKWRAVKMRTVKKLRTKRTPSARTKIYRAVVRDLPRGKHTFYVRVKDRKSGRVVVSKPKRVKTR